MPEKRTYKVDPETGRLAVRTNFPDEGVYIPHAYSVGDPGSAPGFRSSAEVETWVDVTDAIADAIDRALGVLTVQPLALSAAPEPPPE